MKFPKMLLVVPLAILAGCQSDTTLAESPPTATVTSPAVTQTAEAQTEREEAETETEEAENSVKAEAVEAARDLLDSIPLSKGGLIEQLTVNYGYGQDVAEYAAENADADWMEQAVRTAHAFLEMGYVQTQEALQQELIGAEFTPEEAAYGVAQAGSDLPVTEPEAGSGATTGAETSAWEWFEPQSGEFTDNEGYVHTFTVRSAKLRKLAPEELSPCGDVFMEDPPNTVYWGWLVEVSGTFPDTEGFSAPDNIETSYDVSTPGGNWNCAQGFVPPVAVQGGDAVGGGSITGQYEISGVLTKDVPVQVWLLVQAGRPGPNNPDGFPDYMGDVYDPGPDQSTIQVAGGRYEIATGEWTPSPLSE